MMTTVTDSSKLVQAQMRLIELSLGFVSTQAFASAYDLGVFDALTTEPADLERIAQQVGISAVEIGRAHV